MVWLCNQIILSFVQTILLKFKKIGENYDEG